ncbi:MAG: hypothetical protein ACQEVA_11515 [Myxococcota bacterium]
MRRAALLCFVILLFPSSASAHHVVSEAGISWVEPVSIVEVSAEASRFDRGNGFSGNWQVVTLGAEWSALDDLSLSLRVPMAHLSLDDGRRVAGLSDIELSAKYRVFASPHGEFIASAGVGTALPTGVPEDGLGAGHFEVSPFVTVSSAPNDWLILYGAAIDKLSLGRNAETTTIDERAGHGSVIVPHEPHELDTRLGVAILPVDSAYLSARVDHTFVFVGEGAGSTRGRLELGWTRRGKVRVSAAVSEHLSGERRHMLAAELAAAVFF